MKDLLYLSNILESTNLIRKYLSAKKIGDLRNSVLLRDAVSKRIEEIGENIRKISLRIKRSYPEIDWIAFVETRNFLTHVYQMVNVERLWGILKRDIPLLEKQIKKIMICLIFSNKTDYVRYELVYDYEEMDGMLIGGLFGMSETNTKALSTGLAL